VAGQHDVQAEILGVTVKTQHLGEEDGGPKSAVTTQ
jgi:hypothetical protein